MNVAARLAKAGYENGVIFRAFADDVIGLAPPICITETEVDLLIARLRATLNTLLDLKG
jgi:adenosylmethionine-8-amino-7-oxononanoate aminotransferase